MKTYISNNKKYQIYSILVMLFIWTILAYIINSPIKIPSPYLTFKELVIIVTNEKFIIQISTTLFRTSISFVLAFFIGVLLGMMGGFSNKFFYLMNPIMLILKSMPTIAVILLSLIWLGREISPILVSFLISFPIIYTSVVNGIRNIDKNLLEMVDTYGFDKNKKYKHLYLPSINSQLTAISATSFSLAFKVCIAAEVLSQPKYAMGTGFQMEKVALNTAGVLAWSIIAILLAGIFENLIKKILLNRRNYKNQILHIFEM